MTAEHAPVVAIVVHYGDPALTSCAVSSIVNGTSVPSEIIVVDNGPASYPDGAPGVRVLRPGTNVGFAAAVNMAIDSISGGYTPAYVWLFNNDASAESDALARLLATADRLPVHALVSSLVVDARTGAPWFVRAEFLPWRLESRHVTGLPPSETDALLPSAPSWYSVPYLPACSLLAPWPLLTSLNGLDPAFFVYGEDVDFSLRAMRLGYRLALSPRSRVVHATSSGTSEAARMRMQAAAALVLTWRLVPLLTWPALVGAVITGSRRAVVRRARWPLTARLRGYLDTVRGRARRERRTVS